MYLIDTNIWLERLLDQAQSDAVKRLLDQVPSDQLLITDFSFHSIGIILYRLERLDGLERFVQDIFVEGAVDLVSLEPADMRSIVDAIHRFNLDFDDAYQYIAAEKYGAILVSFDEDFDRTERGKKTPMEITESVEEDKREDSFEGDEESAGTGNPH